MNITEKITQMDYLTRHCKIVLNFPQRTYTGKRLGLSDNPFGEFSQKKYHFSKEKQKN